MSLHPVWIVDDDKAIRWVLEKALDRQNILHSSFSNADDALNALYDEQPKVVLSDIRMPGTDGLKFLKILNEKYPKIAVIIMTAHADLDAAVTAFQSGAFEYLPKPFDIEQAVTLIERALQDQAKAEEISPTAISPLPSLLGQAPAMQNVFRAIGRLSQSNVTVLITGESGTGKERVAEALHQHSTRRNKSFVAINTAAIPKDLLESELFGHEKGAFTGALQTRKGRFEEAEGGTLFLDEIGDMPTELQTRLLRVLSDGHFYRIGGHTPIKANVRVIAATHQHLEERVKQGSFREDLFHRLNVIRLKLPALRERPEDIPLLARHFLNKSAQSIGVEVKHIKAPAMDLICRYPFSGNVRELENLCQWLTVMAPGQVIETSDLPSEYQSPSAQSKPIETITSNPIEAATATSQTWETLLTQELQRRLQNQDSHLLDEYLPRFEKICLQAGLAHTQGKKIEAAHLLGWGRNTLARKMQELGMEDH